MRKDHRSDIYSMCLGDGSVWLYPDGKNCRMGISHCKAQLSYLEWKKDLLVRALGGSKVTIHERRDKPEFYIKKCFKYLRQVHRNLYSRNKQKFFTRKVLDFIDEQGLAIWFMDDGSTGVNRNSSGWITSKYAYIYTYCTEEEAHTICTYFKERWGIDAKVGLPRKIKSGEIRYSIAFNTKESDKLAEIIAPTIMKVPCMMYKLQYYPNVKVQERTAPKGDDMFRHSE